MLHQRAKLTGWSQASETGAPATYIKTEGTFLHFYGPPKTNITPARDMRANIQRAISRAIGPRR